MAKVSEYIEKLTRDYKPDDEIAVMLYSKVDVEKVAQQIGFVLTEDEICRVLKLVHETKDSEIGMSWDSIIEAINNVINNGDFYIIDDNEIDEEDE